MPARTHDRARGVRKHRPVGQVGEGVEVGEVQQLLFGALLARDVAQDGHVLRFPGAGAGHCAAHQPAQEFFPVLAPLPHLALPLALALQRRAHVAVEGGVVLVAVEQRGTPAQRFFGRVPGDAGERAVDRNEVEVRIDHRHRLVHAVQHLRGDPALTLGLAAAAHVPGGAGQAQRRPLRAPADHPSPGPRPHRLAFVEQHARIGHHAAGVALDAIRDGALHAGDVLRVDQFLHRNFALMHDVRQPMGVGLHQQQADHPAADVVFPVVLAGGPQRHLQALAALAQAAQHAAVAVTADRRHQQRQHDGHGAQQSRICGICRHVFPLCRASGVRPRV